MKKRVISFLDTTLRDGEQAPGNAMTPEQKVKLALMLEDAGVDTIETGFPASSQTDFLATQMISSKLKKASFATFSRAQVKDVKIALDAGGVSDRHLVMLVATGSDLHLKNKRNITREQGLAEITEAVSYAKKRGQNNIAVGIEDASRSQYDYIEAIITTSIKAGANQIILADTTGYATPKSFGDLIRYVREVAGPDIKVSTHCHNDLGLGVANVLEGIKAGADEVQATIGGIGERAGNTSLEQIAAILYYKGDEYGLDTTIKFDKLYEAYLELKEAIKLEESRMQPLFGKYVFSTAAGIHQQGMLNDPDTYEYVKPDVLGRERQILVTRHSGRTIIRHLLQDLDIPYGENVINYLYEKFISSQHSSTCDDLTTFKNKIQNELKIQSEMEVAQ
ncbi:MULTISPECIES: LeuA family protein [Bacillus cereus group]|uniref:LeuA family protein n=1 Tax=Bacillus cereus group TaxID=86661 RepID=UPI000BF692A0|nr:MULTISPECIES: pyruvate carboxyltransferase [Bacillus cereus group]MBY0018457.1 pyruvate carboxyltransferase [Bacillus cereus]PEY81750.1 pyruvate carboxyltransferase [Bacillus thuringiensis]PFD38595.1 pyruvate carboxyltransferase [Bacillus thuringiensis]PFE60497.1 pyruvate carboxyltransferase [Bacillus thuringiensis]PFI31135.1 pyruvate carboxyltransferase [Bacillus thuringiensis]